MDSDDNRLGLDEALNKLENNVVNFPIGAINLEDLKPLGEKLSDLSTSLKCLKSKVQLIEARVIAQSLSSQGESNVLINDMQTHLSNCLINENASKSVLQSNAVETSLLLDNSASPNRLKIESSLEKLFFADDGVNDMLEESGKLKEKKLEMSDECESSLVEFSDYLKEQKQLREQFSSRNQPNSSSTNEKMNKLIYKINLMKKLIVNIISNDSKKLDNEFFCDMMKKHHELLRHEVILNDIRKKRNQTSN